MKNNKKIMAVVAGAAIASQLLTVGSVVIYAQTTTFTPHNHEIKDENYGYKNDMDIFAANGQDGVNIKFDINEKILKVSSYGLPSNLLNEKAKDEDYLTIKLVKLDKSEKK